MVKRYRCGTTTAYKHGCRCPECSETEQIRRRRYRTAGSLATVKNRDTAQRLAAIGHPNPHRTEWVTDAACRHYPHLDWYGPLRTMGRSGFLTRAAELCLTICRRQCRVRPQCLAYAIAMGETEHGIWGGLTPTNRQHTDGALAVLADLTGRQNRAG